MLLFHKSLHTIRSTQKKIILRNLQGSILQSYLFNSFLINLFLIVNNASFVSYTDNNIPHSALKNIEQLFTQEDAVISVFNNIYYINNAKQFLIMVISKAIKLHVIVYMKIYLDLFLIMN